RCHRGMRADKVYPLKEGGFLHAPHFAKNYPCENCHVSGVHGRPGVKSDCKSCHHDRKIVGQQPTCKGCHPAQHKMTRGTGGVGIKDNPGLMPRETCLSCHFKEGENPRPTLAVCGNCHPASHITLMRDGQNAVRKTISRIQLLEKTATEAAQKGQLTAPAAEDVRKAAQNLNFVLTDKTMGAHNMGYTDQLLDHSEKTFRRALDQVRK
ncbi:MAG: cytochrome c family protein, partial [Nitrospirota bacterium]|nr:cytochrome c family protein [Nitrospirota bacterium]